MFLFYLLLVNSLSFANLPVLIKLRNYLLHIPSSRKFMKKVNAAPIKFRYQTDIKDDFQIECRSNFDNYEKISRNFFYLVAQNSSVILDIGAYSGIYSIIGALANEKANIFSYEPNPQIYNLAKCNLEMNNLGDRVQLFCLALDFEKGKKSLYFNPTEWESATASLNPTFGKSVEVNVNTIDELFSGNHVDLIKIDVEGFESNVFLGGLKTLKRCMPIILSEALTATELEKQLGILGSIGYENPVQVSKNPLSSDSRNYIWFNFENRKLTLDTLSAAKHL